VDLTPYLPIITACARSRKARGLHEPLKRPARDDANACLAGQPEDDAVQIAYLEAEKLVKAYDPSRGVPFDAFLCTFLPQKLRDRAKAKTKESSRTKFDITLVASHMDDPLAGLLPADEAEAPREQQGEEKRPPSRPVPWKRGESGWLPTKWSKSGPASWKGYEEVRRKELDKKHRKACRAPCPPSVFPLPQEQQEESWGEKDVQALCERLESLDLSPAVRETIDMRLAGMKRVQIAERRGESKAAVTKRLKATKEKLNESENQGVCRSAGRFERTKRARDRRRTVGNCGSVHRNGACHIAC
jgi:RNA polymerase sigma factor (sigma-70 family)